MDYLKVLIVEDNPLVRGAIDHTLKTKYDCKVFMASNVDDGLAFMLDEKPDIIILDYDLEDSVGINKNGLAFLEGMRSLKVKIPTVIVSGQPNKSLAVALIKNGDVDYVYKDDDDFLDKMLEAVESILSIKSINENLKINNVYLKKRTKQIILLFSIVIIAILVSVFIWG